MNTRTLGIAAAALLAAACGSDTHAAPAQNPTPTPTPTPAASTLRTWVVPSTASKLDATQRAAFTAGTLYVNAHTSAHPNGEIRGQLDLGGTIRLATLDGAQETPSVPTNAFGAGAVSMDTQGNVRGFVVTSGLTGTAAHIHLAGRGTPGSIIVPLTGGPDLWVVPDQTKLTPDQQAAFGAGNLFVNVHTAAHPNGEIRGQLDKTGQVRVASLEGAQETPPVTTSAYGAGIFTVDATSGQVRGFVLASGIAGTAAHLHQAAKGTPGSIVVPMAGGPALWVVPDQAPNVPDAVKTAYTAGEIYANVHSAAHPSGEIRGQLDDLGDARLASLDGAQEVPPVTTTAQGASVISVDGGSGEVRGFIVTEGLVSPTVAHVHPGARGVAGAPIVPLAP